MALRSRTAGEIVVETLEGAGVRHCFGVPGESFLGILDALHDSSIEFVSTRHEGGASFMASGYSKISGEVGVCLGTRAVGTANLAIGVHNAHQDSTPMIAIAGQVNRSFIGREAFQEVDLVAAMRPFTKWATEIPSADLAPEIMARALQVATTGRPGPVFISVPQDVCDEATTSESRPLSRTELPGPDSEAVGIVREALFAARAPLVWAGGGVLNSPGALDLIVEFAEATELPVITGWRHHDVFPNDHRLFLGCAGLGAAAVVWERLAEADVILVLGNRMQENGTDGYKLPASTARLFQVDLEASVMAGHRSPELAIQADVGNMLRALLQHRPSLGSESAERRRKNVADRQRFDKATELPTEPGSATDVSYPEVLRVLSGLSNTDTVITSDAGNFYAWMSRYHRFNRPHTYLGPASGAMGYGLPAAIGAKLARPDLPVLSVSGDGGILMTIAELETAVRYGANVVAMVLDNSRHGTIRMHQERQHPGRVIGTELGLLDLALVARGLGAVGYVVEEPGALAPALSGALESEAPALIQVRMDRAQLSVETRIDASDRG
jgi:acetolactate synthase-1/2/3 large subunit